MFRSPQVPGTLKHPQLFGKLPTIILVCISYPNRDKTLYFNIYYFIFSLESRDNPFVPGGSLDQEASDILKRATIIRDQFILSEHRKYSDIEQNPAPENTEVGNDVNNTCENSNKDIVEETILQQSTNSTQALPETKLNGKSISTDSQPVDINQKDGTLDRSLKDKKKQKKCCSVM